MSRKKVPRVREKKRSIRFTAEEEKIIEMVAEEGWNGNSSVFCREAILTAAERHIENKELAEGLGGEEKAKDVQVAISEMIAEAKEVLANSIHQSNEGLSQRITKLEKFMEVFLYAYLYHTPEIDENMKQEASVAADKRVKKVMALCEKE